MCNCRVSQGQAEEEEQQGPLSFWDAPRIFAAGLMTIVVLAIAGCFGAVYKADAFIPGGGVDLMKTYCYMSGKCGVRQTPEVLGVSSPLPAASAAWMDQGYFKEHQLPLPPPEVPALLKE